MPSLNFQSRFAPLVESGAKRQTIRATRKHPIRVGDTLYLYTGLRRPGANLLKAAVCTETFSIGLEETPVRPQISVDGRLIGWNGLEAAEIAQRDGFDTVLEMLEWFRETHGFPFAGQVIRW